MSELEKKPTNHQAVSVDQERIDRMYALLEQSDQDTKALLQWAISKLEELTRPCTDIVDLVMKFAILPQHKLDEIIDTLMFYDIIQGYLIIAMRDAGESKDAIDNALCALKRALNNGCDAATARNAYLGDEADSADDDTLPEKVTEKELFWYEHELRELKTVKRQEVHEKIKKAREKGDLSENVEYDAAKNEQALIESRIKELEKIISVFRFYYRLRLRV